MRAVIQLRVTVTEVLAERLRQRIDALPFKVIYREEQHGSALVSFIGCTPAQEKPLRDILDDLGAASGELSDE